MRIAAMAPLLALLACAAPVIPIPPPPEPEPVAAVPSQARAADDVERRYGRAQQQALHTVFSPQISVEQVAAIRDADLVARRALSRLQPPISQARLDEARAAVHRLEQALEFPTN